jgi:allantoin racemase
LPMLLFSRECPFAIDGALVLNGIAVAVKAAEMALGLYNLTGSVVSRRGTYAKASAACVDEYLRCRW